MPLAAVPLGLCSPALLLPGFMSHRSMVEGPPLIHRMIRLFCFFFISGALARSSDKNDRPGMPTAAPAIECLRKWRRSLVPNMVWRSERYRRVGRQVGGDRGEFTLYPRLIQPAGRDGRRILAR